jgi:hypothetical protein
MKKIFVLLAVIILTGFGCSQKNNVEIQSVETPQDRSKIICEKAGGTLRRFNDECADDCRSPGTLALCGMHEVEDCDCGPKKCWNGTTCEKN